ncbi:MAG: RagB/SusD family nutrient uptake outer membrane protein [Sediminibacterium sp.]|nr:RagB/SusD family nutrient uptake outer membrane protein [Sediminibacterium sp.]
MNKKLTLKNPLLIIWMITFLVITATLSWKKSNYFRMSPIFLQNTTGCDTNYNYINNVYQNLTNFFGSQTNLGISSVTTDEAMVPTRGTDWDDNGVWRTLHNHKFDQNNGIISENFASLLQSLRNISVVLNNRNKLASNQYYEALFLKNLIMFEFLDYWGQVPNFPACISASSMPTMLSSSQATDSLLLNLSTIIIPNLPLQRGIDIASKDAARALYMKVLINKPVYKSADRFNFVFDTADLNEVINQANLISASNLYSYNDNYFDNFSPTNFQSINNSELVFSLYHNTPFVATRWANTLHYNQDRLGGWNGFTTLSDFYDLFEPSDLRREQNYPNFTNLTGTKMGFLYGQQYRANGTQINDRYGKPLFYTRYAKDLDFGSERERAGIRVLKYVPYNLNGDFQTFNDPNHFVVFRYSDILLMKAEAILRDNNSNNDTMALQIVNDLRTNPSRNASALSKLTLDELLAERGRELYWENWRRNDLVRFKKFLDPRWEKNYISPLKALLMPIPINQLALNPNFIQNPGY